MSRNDGSSGGRGITRGMIPLLALHAVNEYYRLPIKPPVTAGLLVANTLIYLRPGVLHTLLPSIDQVWFNPRLIIRDRDLKRFFLSAFYHMGESHLVFNMMSLLWKGIQMETSMGSVEFASMIAALVPMSQGITVLLAKSLSLFFDYEKAFKYEYSVGFSGVLFAMKVVLNSQSDNYTNVYGLMVPARHAAWAELILIQMFVPNVSFLGHLGGILAGILYLRLKGSYQGPDPLTTVIRGAIGILSWPLKFARNWFRLRRRRISGRGRVGGGGSRTGRSFTSGPWICPACTYENSDRLNVCEMCSTGRAENDSNGSTSSTQSSPTRSRSGNLSLEELRLRRIERFGR
ncbi:hypothetical protein MKW94_018852 [Papaver nudicaule]|uniref:RanBP2-type domain-containing protein n=1 Tax=Papaver nudicaule TaxID=74823 RepID=A0AA41VX52_PAPNU|nr:hypothetical protein [Papaver nudicaule]